MNKWDEFFMKQAKLCSTMSKDKSTKVGACIAKGKKLISIGYNGYPAGVNDEPTTREDKLFKTIHAELNAILSAKCDLTGCTIYGYPMPPCSQCAAAIIQSGITRVVTKEPTIEQAERWYRSFTVASQLYREAGVTIEYMEGV